MSTNRPFKFIIAIEGFRIVYKKRWWYWTITINNRHLYVGLTFKDLIKDMIKTKFKGQVWNGNRGSK